MLNNTQTILLELLKSSLFDQPLELPQSADSVDWDAVLKEAVDQTVAGIVAPTVLKVCEKIPDSKCNQNWKALSFKICVGYVCILREQTQLVKLFEDNGIPLIILKGNASALYYPQPSQRTMGDIDFLIPQNKFKDSERLMEKSGYVRVYGGEEDDRHIGYVKNGVLFEMHHHFSSFGLDIEPVVISGLKRAVRANVENAEFPMLPVLENGIVLLAHIRQHLMEEAYSLGLRQVIDWMMYVFRYCNSELDDGTKWDDKFLALAKEFRLDKLAIAVTCICKKRIGLPKTPHWCNRADERTADELFHEIMTSGNFGSKIESKDLTIKQGVVLYRNEGFFKRLQSSGLQNWEMAEKHPILRPFAWVYQSCRIIGIIIRKMLTGNEMMQVKEANAKTKLLKKLGI